MSMQQRGERHVERMAGVSERGVDHIETMDGPEILNSVDEIEKLDKVARRNFGLDDIQQTGGLTIQLLNMVSGEQPARPSQSLAISRSNRGPALLGIDARNHRDCRAQRSSS